MKLALKIMFVVFILWMITGAYLINTEHEKAQVVMDNFVSTNVSVFASLVRCPATLKAEFRRVTPDRMYPKGAKKTAHDGFVMMIYNNDDLGLFAKDKCPVSRSAKN